MTLFEPIFQALDEAGVRYVVVGGVAVVLRGHVRFTADLDIAVDLTPEPAAKAVAALTAIGLRPRVPVDAADFADPDVRESWAEERGMTVFSMWDPGDPLRSVDLFVREPIDFEEMWNRAEVVSVGDASPRVASIPDLIRLKRLSGRTQDLADVEALERILDEGDGS